MGTTAPTSNRCRRRRPEIELVGHLDGGNATWLRAGQFEESEEVDVVERSFRTVRHMRQKYRCACGGCIDTALGPLKLILGGRYSVDFAVAAVAVAKYLDHLQLQLSAWAYLSFVDDCALWALPESCLSLWVSLSGVTLPDSSMPSSRHQLSSRVQGSVSRGAGTDPPCRALRKPPGSKRSGRTDRCPDPRSSKAEWAGLRAKPERRRAATPREPTTPFRYPAPDVAGKKSARSARFAT